MKFTGFYNEKTMNTSASAPCANAASFCAQSASANTAIIAVLDAIIMASIIICGIIVILGLHLVSLLVLLALVVRLVIRNLNTPWQKEFAI